jgi:hypothetical protein
MTNRELAAFLIGFLVLMAVVVVVLALVFRPPSWFGAAASPTVVAVVPAQTAIPTETATPAPTATATSTPWRLPTWTATPLPSDTPTPSPTSTALPTNTPTPTEPLTDIPPPTLTATLPPVAISPDVQLYAAEVVEWLDPWIAAMTTLSELAKEPKLDDEDWRRDMLVAMVVIKVTHEELSKMDVPPDVAEIHEAMLDATGDYDEAMDLLAVAIDNLDANVLMDAFSLMDEGERKMNEATALLEIYLKPND